VASQQGEVLALEIQQDSHLLPDGEVGLTPMPIGLGAKHALDARQLARR
jgi:hypothetical protein